MIEVPLNKGMVALIDDEDADIVAPHTWTALWQRKARTHYARGNLAGGKGRMAFLHRMILRPESGYVVHHKNHNGLDNRRENLVVCTVAQNNCHQVKRARRTSSRFKGVTWVKRVHLWMAQIGMGGKNYGLGYFKDEVDAALAYDAAAVEHFGDFALTNATLFPEVLKRVAP